MLLLLPEEFPLGHELIPLQRIGFTKSVLLFANAYKPGRSSVELLLVFQGTEVVGRSLIERLGTIGIYIHSTHCAEWMIVRRGAQLSVDQVRTRIRPSSPLILHVVSCLLGGFSAEVSLYDPKCQVDSAGKPAGGSKIAIFDEPHTSFDVNVGKLCGQVHIGSVVGRRGFARQ